MHLFSLLILSLLLLKNESESVPLVQAVKDALGQYQAIALEAVKVSVNVSIAVSEMTYKLYRESDILHRRGATTKEFLIEKSHKMMIKSVPASQCINGIQLSNQIKRMLSVIAGSTRCLLDEAAKGAATETQLTEQLVLYRAHVMEGRSAMSKCTQVNDTMYLPCQKAIQSELDVKGVDLMNKLKALQRETAEALHSLQLRASSCTEKGYRIIEEKKSLIDDVKACSVL